MTGFQLLPHQVIDAAFLADRKFAGLFNDMGSGKTRTALEAIKLVNAACALIIVPPIAMPMWAEESVAHLGGTAQVLKTGTTKIDPNANWIICSYAIATKRAKELRAMMCADVLICDESHALKSTSAKRTKAIIGKGGICEAFTHSWMLTGTPITRWADDLFPFLCRAGNGVLLADIGGISKEKFELKYCVRQAQQVNTKWGRKTVHRVVGSRNLLQLHRLMFDNGMAVRRQIEDVHAAMPPITHSNLHIKLTRSDDFDDANAAIKDQTMAQLQAQIAQGGEHLATLRRLLGVAKVPAAAEVIYERMMDSLGPVVDVDDPLMSTTNCAPILVGAWHRDVINQLVDALMVKGLRVRSITGSTSDAQKQSAVKDFNQGHVNVLVGQIGAMGVSLNLQKLAHRILMVEQDWSPAVLAQFYARIWRMGQERHVHVDTIVSDNKLDKAVTSMLARKASAHRKILGDVV